MRPKIVYRAKSIPQETSPPTNSQGSYAISSIDTRPWSSTNVTTSRPKTRRSKLPPTVVNPIFKECADLISDLTWKNTFIEASLGKLPRGFTFKDGYVTHKIRNKVTRMEISPIPEIAINECLYFFKEKAGIMSQDDQKRAKEEFEEHLLTTGALCPTKWSEIRKKKIKDVLVATFISRISKEVGLSASERDALRNKIYLGFILGCFGNEQVELNKGYIKNIAGLEFDPTTRTFNINPKFAPKQGKKTRRVEKVVKSKQSFYVLWVKYLESLEKRVVRNGNLIPSTPHQPYQDRTPRHDDVISSHDDLDTPTTDTLS